jgi:hypothetical protein
MAFPPITREAERLAGIDCVKRWLEERDRRRAEEAERRARESTREWKIRHEQDRTEEYGGA